jgi:hypothetical protein
MPKTDEERDKNYMEERAKAKLSSHPRSVDSNENCTYPICYWEE